MIERREKKPISGFGGKNLRAGEVPVKGGKKNQKQCWVLMVGDLTGRVFSSERPGKCFFVVYIKKTIGRPGAVRYCCWLEKNLM